MSNDSEKKMIDLVAKQKELEEKRKKAGIKSASVESDTPPELSWHFTLIEPGIYKAVAWKRVSRKVKRFEGEKILYLWFEIKPPSKYAGCKLFRSYHYDNISPTSSYVREWIIANRGKNPEQWDKMSPDIFDNKVFEIEVRNAKSGLYSVVGKIIRLVDGGLTDDQK